MTTAFGALLAHITINADAKSFQPMNVNFGLMPELGDLPAPVGEDGKRLRGKMRMQAKKLARQHAFTARARADFSDWQQEL
jgi:methylenetetrahydrofolate--tRNA-(uracil-5-)-methyltransferase